MDSVTPTRPAKSTKPRVLLIPWDPTSPEHVQRLVEQRIACGWDYEEVEGWRAKHESGTLNMQWVVSTISICNSISSSDFHRFSKIPILRKRPSYSSILRHIPKRKSRWLIRRFPLGANQEVFLCRRESLSRLGISL
jgi:hypothetical protein